MNSDILQQAKTHQILSKINYLGLQSLQNSLSDQATCNAYIQSIKNNQNYIIGKTVLHLTTGCNCLYSIIAAQVGAKKVFCVINGSGQIQTKNKYMMQEIVKENGYQGIIQVKFHKQFGEQIQVIIGQPMGYNFIYDGLLDRMIQARDLYMKDPNKGLIIPNKIRYKCVFVRDQYFIDKKVQFWDKVYGIQMCSMKNWISHQPMVRFVDPSLIVSQTAKFVQYDIKKVSYEEIDNVHSKSFIKTPMDIIANGIAFWFQIQCVKADGEKIQVKASPWNTATKWTQMTLYCKKLWKLTAGGTRKVQFIGKKNHIEGSVVMRVKVDDQQQQIYRFS